MTKVCGEQRLYPRRPLNAMVIFEDEFGDPLFYVRSKDLSEGGMLLEGCRFPLRLKSLMFLSFHLPGEHRPMRLTGEVVRMGTAEEAGVGVRFVDVDQQTLKQLRNFLGND